MPGKDFSIGPDITLDIIGPTGPIRFDGITDFDAKPEYHSISSTPINGETKDYNRIKRWTGTFGVDRTGPDVDEFFIQEEANQYAGLTASTVTIIETITERDGSISQYRYLSVSLTLQDRGKWSGDDKVAMRLGFTARRKVK